MNLRRYGAMAMAGVSIALMAPAQSLELDPFAVLQSEVAINANERQELDERQVILKILPASDRELAVLAAGALNASAAELSAKINDIAELKRSSLVPEIHRFSDPPSLTDLDSLTLDDVDLDAIRGCRPGACALKLSAQEIGDLHGASEGSPEGSAEAVNQEFRRLVLNRVNAYLKSGLSGIPEYATGHDEVDLQSAFTSLLQQANFVQANTPELAAYLARYPDAPPPPATTSSFLYWSKEQYTSKPIISVTQVTIVDPHRSDAFPELLAASKEVFATRYTSGNLLMTFLIRGTDARAPHYLVYVNRTWVDGLNALWRPLLNYHVRGHGRRVFAGVRARIEGNSSNAD